MDAQTNNELLEQALNDVYSSRSIFIEIDSVLQEKYKDTIQKVKIQIHGLWHYQGIEKRQQSKWI